MTGLLSAWHNWQERRTILRDIRRQRADDSERNRFRVRDELTDALAALELNDRRKATAIWIDALARYPAEIRKSPLTLDVLLKLNRFDEAEALMRDGRKKHPREVFFASGLASVALKRGDYDAAIQHYAALRKQFPGVYVGYTLGAQALTASNRMEEADALAEEAMKLFPAEITGFLEYARSAVKREDWTEAMRRWQIVQDMFEDRSFGLYGRAQALIKLQRYDEADEVLTAARFRFPTESGLLAEFARCAQARGDVPEAVKRWKRRIERVPMEVHGYHDAAAAFVEMGEYAEAESILRAGVDRFPVEDGPMINLAKFLHERGDFPAEAEAWSALRQVFTDNEESYTRGADALRRAGRLEEASALLEEHQNRLKRH